MENGERYGKFIAECNSNFFGKISQYFDEVMANAQMLILKCDN